MCVGQQKVLAVLVCRDFQLHTWVDERDFDVVLSED
jgi:hypothetical protein